MSATVGLRVRARARVGVRVEFRTRAEVPARPGGPRTVARQWNRLPGASGAALKPGDGALALAAAPTATPEPTPAPAAAAAIASNSSSSLQSRRLAILAVGAPVGTVSSMGGPLDPAADATGGSSLATEHCGPASEAEMWRVGGPT